MDYGLSRKRLRNSSKCCIECRRRKVRCTWQNNHDSSCDGCLARNHLCRVQQAPVDHETFDEAKTRPSPNNERFNRLTQQVEDLDDRLQVLERKSIQVSAIRLDSSHKYGLNNGTSAPTTIHVPPDNGTDLPGGNPTHIRSLFQATLVDGEGLVANTPSSTAGALHTFSAEYQMLREELLKLVPSPRDIETVLDHVQEWWSFVDTGVPSISIGTKKEFRAVLERAKTRDSDPALVAMWLVTAAMTVLQLPHDIDETLFENVEVLKTFPNNVRTRIEVMLAIHQEIAATVWGIECSLILVKLQLNWGRMRKAWLTLRSAIAFAELAGFPDICRSSETSAFLVEQDEVVCAGDSILKSSIWIQLCVLERILGVLLNLPSTARSIPSQLPRYLLPSHSVSREIFWTLSKIAVQIRDRDDNITFSKTKSDWISATDAIHRQLQDLSDIASMSEHISQHSGLLPLPPFHQHIYYYLLLRTHLPLMLRMVRATKVVAPQTDPTVSRLDRSSSAEDEADLGKCRSHDLCVYACLCIGKVYIQPIIGPTHGLFPVRISDFIAFTAIVILMLEEEGLLPSSAETIYRDASRDAELLHELTATLKEVAKQDGRVIAVQAVKAIDSIRASLAMRENPSSAATSIRIPLLGATYVKWAPPSARPVSVDSGQFTSTTNTSKAGMNKQTQISKDKHKIASACLGTGAKINKNAAAGTVNSHDPKSTFVQPWLGPGTNDLMDQSCIMDSSIPVALGDDTLPYSPNNNDQYDWVSETMNIYVTGRTSTEDALWLWDDEIFGAFRT